MDYQKIVQSKTVTAVEAVKSIRDNEVICCAGPSNLPTAFLTELHRLKEFGTKNCTVFHVAGQVRGVYEYLTDPGMAGHLRVHTSFHNRLSAEYQEKYGIISHVPYPGYAGYKPYPCDVFVTACSPVDKNGYVRLSLGLMGEGAILPNAKRIFCEINENYPFTNGDVAIPVKDVDCFYPGFHKMVIYPETELNEEEIQIGKNVASLVEDGSTIQLGIGGIPNAASNELVNKNDLGIHSEMITTNMARLSQMGVVTGKKKTLHPGKIIGSFAMGSQLLYDFIDDNPVVNILSGNYVINPYVISQNYKMVSINTCIQVDLTGQVCSESFGPVQYSAVGGALNFAHGAHYANDGKAVMALKSTARKGTVSTIQAMLTPGSVVTVPRTLVDYIVTEYGIAELTNKSVRERVENMISVAHPDFRDELRQKAQELKITKW